ncbi:hypothetical protein RB601_002126 [Gaeumannomyces tritici]
MTRKNHHIRPYPPEYTGSRPLSLSQTSEGRTSTQVGDHWGILGVFSAGAPTILYICKALGKIVTFPQCFVQAPGNGYYMELFWLEHRDLSAFGYERPLATTISIM